MKLFEVYKRDFNKNIEFERAAGEYVYNFSFGASQFQISFIPYYDLYDIVAEHCSIHLDEIKGYEPYSLILYGPSGYNLTNTKQPHVIYKELIQAILSFDRSHKVSLIDADEYVVDTISTYNKIFNMFFKDKYLLLNRTPTIYINKEYLSHQQQITIDEVLQKIPSQQSDKKFKHIINNAKRSLQSGDVVQYSNRYFVVLSRDKNDLTITDGYGVAAVDIHDITPLISDQSLEGFLGAKDVYMSKYGQETIKQEILAKFAAKSRESF